LIGEMNRAWGFVSVSSKEAQCNHLAVCGRNVDLNADLIKEGSTKMHIK
jgi:hypothetical protein